MNHSRVKFVIIFGFTLALFAGKFHRLVQQFDAEDDIDAGVEPRPLQPREIPSEDRRRHVHSHASAVQDIGSVSAQEAHHNGQSGQEVEAHPQQDVQVLHLSGSISTAFVSGFQHGSGLRVN